MLASAVVACAGSLPPPVDADVTWARGYFSGVTREQLQKGRSLYVGNCAGCHTLYPPERVVTHEWPDNMLEMSRRANLEDSERTLVERYLVTAARNERAASLIRESASR